MSGKYKFYIVDEYEHFQYRDQYSEHEYKPNIKRFKVVRALNTKNALRIRYTYFGLNNESWNAIMREYISGPFRNKKEADSELERLRKEHQS